LAEGIAVVLWLPKITVRADAYAAMGYSHRREMRGGRAAASQTAGATATLVGALAHSPYYSLAP
jgi:hypothetical protein